MKDIATLRLFLDAPQSPTGSLLMFSGTVRRAIRTRIEVSVPCYPHSCIPNPRGVPVFYPRALRVDTKRRRPALLLSGESPPSWTSPELSPLREGAPILGERLPGAGAPYIAVTATDLRTVLPAIELLYRNPLAAFDAEGYRIGLSIESRYPSG